LVHLKNLPRMLDNVTTRRNDLVLLATPGIYLHTSQTDSPWRSPSQQLGARRGPYGRAALLDHIHGLPVNQATSAGTATLIPFHPPQPRQLHLNEVNAKHR